MRNRTQQKLGLIKNKVRHNLAIKVAIVSSIRPATNYSAYLISELQRKLRKEIEVLVYSSKEQENFKVPLKNIKLVWSKNVFYPFRVMRQAMRDKPDIVHLQHEINMFGGLGTAIIFPLLPLLLKIVKSRVVVTIHAVVDQGRINKEFLESFASGDKKLSLFLVRFFFRLLYYLTGVFSDRLIVHSMGMKSLLVNPYNVDKRKIEVIPHGVPNKINFDWACEPKFRWAKGISTKTFLLSYGYLHRRKGLELILKSFQQVLVNYPTLFLVIAGGTLQKDYEVYLKQLVKDLKIEEKVIFTGFVSEAELNWLMTRCKFILLPAKYSIAASGPLAQAIARHVPTIVSDVGVFREEIEDFLDGVRAKNNIDSWTKRIEQLLANDELYLKIVNNLKKKHRERCWSQIARKTIKIYGTMMER
jgi:glycosyltransferase involved in cell wall biosynthesis